VLPKIYGSPLIFLQRLKLATSRLAGSGLCQGPSQNLTQKKSGRGHGLGELAKILRFPFNISATAEASYFKFGMQLEFAKAHHKITPRIKEWLKLLA